MTSIVVWSLQDTVFPLTRHNILQFYMLLYVPFWTYEAHVTCEHQSISNTHNRE